MILENSKFCMFKSPRFIYTLTLVVENCFTLDYKFNLGFLDPSFCLIMLSEKA